MAPDADKPSAGAKRITRAKKKPTTAKKRAAAPRAKKRAAAPRVKKEAVVAAPASPLAKPSQFMAATSVRYGDITAFLRQLIMLLEAGTPLLRSLKTLSERGEKSSVRALVADIAQYVEMGNPLWEAFDRHPKYFDTVFVNLIKASEASGTLVTVLQRLTSYREQRDLLRKRVRAGMLYPAILVLVCAGVIVFIAKVIIPEFRSMFDKFDISLSGWTRGLMGGIQFVGDFWWLGALAAIVLVLVYKLWYVQNPLRRLKADHAKLKVPIVGKILLKNATVEFTRTMAMLLRSGLSMMATLELVRNAIHNRAYAQTLQSMRDSVEAGEGLEKPMRAAADIIPPVVADMMVTGEESGRLDRIAEQIADTYEEEVNIAITTLGDALQPILTIVLGIIVGLVVLSVGIPLISMIEQLGAG
ncbi:MAG: hypothetical protein GWP08_00945 [Nitrospiraceae bacterium]|nr:hypothetical protein [Nitrospiraceae bacterium]